MNQKDYIYEEIDTRTEIRSDFGTLQIFIKKKQKTNNSYNNENNNNENNNNNEEKKRKSSPTFPTDEYRRNISTITKQQELM